MCAQIEDHIYRNEPEASLDSPNSVVFRLMIPNWFPQKCSYKISQSPIRRLLQAAERGCSALRLLLGSNFDYFQLPVNNGHIHAFILWWMLVVERQQPCPVPFTPTYRPTDIFEASRFSEAPSIPHRIVIAFYMYWRSLEVSFGPSYFPTLAIKEQEWIQDGDPTATLITAILPFAPTHLCRMLD